MWPHWEKYIRGWALFLRASKTTGIADCLSGWGRSPPCSPIESQNIQGAHTLWEQKDSGTFLSRIACIVMWKMQKAHRCEKKLVLVHLLIVLFGNAKVNLFLSKRSYVFLWYPSLNTKEIFFLNALSPWRTKLNCPIQATKWNKHASYIPLLASLCSTAEFETDTEHCCLLPITPFVILSAYHSCCPNNWCGSAPGSLTVGCLSVWRGSGYGRGKAGRKSFNDWRWPFSFQWLIFVWGLALTKWACLSGICFQTVLKTMTCVL